MHEVEEYDIPMWFVLATLLVACAAGFATGFVFGERSASQRIADALARQQVREAHAGDIAKLREAEADLERLKAEQLQWIMSLEDEK